SIVYGPKARPRICTHHFVAVAVFSVTTSLTALLRFRTETRLAPPAKPEACNRYAGVFRKFLLAMLARLEVDGEAALDQTRHAAIDVAGPHPHANQWRRTSALYSDAGQREVDDFAFVGFAGLELEFDHLRAIGDRRPMRRLLDAEVTVNGERQLLGHLLALVGGEIEDNGDFALAALAGDVARDAAEAGKVNDDALSNLRQDRRGDADIAGRDVRRPAFVLTA